MRSVSAACGLIVILSACGGSNEDWTVSSEKRCESDGLCLVTAKNGVLRGAFRQGEKEVGFDVVSAPNFAQTLLGGEQYCGRIVFDYGGTFYVASNQSCPRGFVSGMNPNVDGETLTAYRNLIPILADALSHKTAPRNYSGHLAFAKNMADDASKPSSVPDAERAPETTISADQVLEEFPLTQDEIDQTAMKFRPRAWRMERRENMLG